MVDVHKLDEGTFEVVVAGPPQTTHRVTVNPEDWQRLTGGRVAPEVLVERSFDFLLEREPNTSILSSFDITVISQYFPEYESIIGAMLDQ